jgi:hypothetical protein
MTEEPLGDLLLSTTTVDALGLAAAGRDGRPLSSFEILAAIISVDATGDWEEVQVRSTFLSRDEAACFTDPEDAPGGVWDGVPLTRTAREALGIAAQLSKTYKLFPMPPGALALGLIWDPAAGAARALLDQSDIAHSELLDVIQDEVLGTRLEDLSAALDDPPDAAPEYPEWLGSDTAHGTSVSAAACLRRARELDGRRGDPGALALLAAAVELTADVALRALLDAMLLDSTYMRDAMQQTVGVPEEHALAVMDCARVRFDVESPDAAALIVAATVHGGERVDRALHRLGVSAAEVGAQVAEWRLRRDGHDTISNHVVAITVANMLVGIATSVLIVRNVLDQGGWWKLLFLVAVWYGYPQFSPLAGMLVAGVMSVVVSPVVGAVHLASALVDVLQANTERRHLWGRTGIRLSLLEQRHVTMRFLNDRARAVELRRQHFAARLRRLSDDEQTADPSGGG